MILGHCEILQTTLKNKVVATSVGECCFQGFSYTARLCTHLISTKKLFYWYYYILRIYKRFSKFHSGKTAKSTYSNLQLLNFYSTPNGYWTQCYCTVQEGVLSTFNPHPFLFTGFSLRDVLCDPTDLSGGKGPHL